VSPFEVYDRVVAIGGTPPFAARVVEMRRAFEARTGAFGAQDRWFESRSRAFWDDALTRQGFARDVSKELPREASAWIDSFARAHRGIFSATERDGRWVLEDRWSGVEIVVDEADDSSREALHAASGLFDARIVAIDEPLTVAMLPGAVFHAEEATSAIEGVLEAARALGRATDDVLDALLRMDRSFQSLSRVKAAYAYRPQSLG
jgi:hypothetical protein